MKFLLPIALISSSFGTKVTLTLGDSPDENLITIKATVNGTLSDTATTTYSGTIELDLGIDTGEVTSFEMTGGKVSATDATFLFAIPDFFSQSVSFVDLKASPVSPNGAESLATPGEFSATGHYFLFNEGCLVSAGTFESSKSLVSDTPFAAAGTEKGTISLVAVQQVFSSLSAEVIGTSYAVNLSLPLNSTVTSSEGGLVLVTETTGMVTAGGTAIAYRHPFYPWAAANAPLAGNALSFTADADQDGQQDGISWALGFDAGASNKEIPFNYDAPTGEFSLTLPGVTRSALTLQMSTTLAGNDWIDVPGTSPIPAGTSGSLVLPANAEPVVFYRFVASLD